MSAESCDRVLVLRAQSGEHGAFNALVRRYRHRVMKLSMRYIRNRADAEDAVQNTFIKAYWGLPNFRGDAAFYSWLHRIAVNSAKTILSLRAREERVFRRAAWYDDDATDASTARTDLDTPEDLALTDQIRDAVNAAIESLCEEQRTAIVLREFEGFSYSQIAAAMSCPVGTVRSRVFRGRKAIDTRLRQVLDGGLRGARRSASLHSDHEIRASAGAIDSSGYKHSVRKFQPGGNLTSMESSPDN